MVQPERRKRWGRRFLFIPYQVWILAMVDVAAVAVSLILAYCLRMIFPGSLPLSDYAGLAPVLLLFPVVYAVLKIYPGALFHPAEELKRISRATSLGFLLMAATFFLSKNADSFSRVFFLGAWCLALFMVPLARHKARMFFSRFDWWQMPTVLMGSPQALQRLCEGMLKYPLMGLVPAALVVPAAEAGQDAELSPVDRISAGLAHVPVFTLGSGAESPGGEQLLEKLAERWRGALMAIHLPSIPAENQEKLLEVAGRHFYHLLLLPEFSWVYCIPSQVVHFSGSFALTVQRNLCDGRRLKFKRMLDLALSCLLGSVALPLSLVLAVLIRLDSPGPVLFRHKRIGLNGMHFTVYKFRTMRKDAEKVLQTYLREHPEEAVEWAATQKLRNDPRITRMGGFLRKTSLDELPQIINVLRGEMSLVGPRPIVDSEVSRYGDVFPLYARVHPGITGLWQVSGRNDVSYEERVALDRYYITNWSVWLDLYILARTVPEVMFRRGAY